MFMELVDLLLFGVASGRLTCARCFSLSLEGLPKTGTCRLVVSPSRSERLNSRVRNVEHAMASFTHSFTHSLTHSLPHSLTDSLTHSHSLTLSLSLSHSLAPYHREVALATLLIMVSVHLVPFP